MFNKVFISYAKEDIIFAEKLYSFLIKNGYKPWLDKKSLLPGQLWNNEIRKALRSANYIILLLSNISVKKRGYVQREFKIAIEYFEEKLDDDIYIIPLKINDCEIPQALNKFQWVEYNDLDCFNLVLSSINTQKNKYEESERQKIAINEKYEYIEVTKKFEYGNYVKFKINSTILQFVDEHNEGIKEVNSIIQGRNIEEIVSSRKMFFDLNGNTISLDFESSDWFFDIHYSANLITNSVLSLNENVYSFTGGAHGVGTVIGLNYFINPTFHIKLSDLFDYDDHEKILNLFSDFCYEELKKRHNEWTEPAEIEKLAQTKDSLFWKDSLAPKWENFNNFLISKNGLEIIFNHYQVSAYAFGIHLVNLPYLEIINNLSKPEKIIEFLKRIK
ncbi:MAG: hypothetical protein A2033_11780 [Bacteroidetes bacterium GWA2_31_9]|nr:MAG: hypothetical protein A2033_11780 [Bacteroidetes bacterium GWA2_31_9]